MMKKRVLAVLLAVGVCAAMSGCAKNEKPMSPDQVESTSSTVSSSGSEGGSGAGESSSTESISGVSVVEGPIESSSGESSGGVVVPRKPDGTNDLSEMRALYVGDEVYYADWTLEEFVASGWELKDNLDEVVTHDQNTVRPVANGKWSRENGLLLSVINIYDEDVKVSSCPVYSMTATREGAYISVKNGRVFVGMSRDVLGSNMASCRLVKTESALLQDSGNRSPATLFQYISDDDGVIYEVLVSDDTSLVTMISVSSLRFYQRVSQG